MGRSLEGGREIEALRNPKYFTSWIVKGTVRYHYN